MPCSLKFFVIQLAFTWYAPVHSKTPNQLHCVEMLILSKAFLKLIVGPHLDFLIFKLFLVFLKSLDISKFKFLSKWLLNPRYSKFEGNLPKTFLSVICTWLCQKIQTDDVSNNKIDVCTFSAGNCCSPCELQKGQNTLILPRSFVSFRFFVSSLFLLSFSPISFNQSFNFLYSKLLHF